MHVQHVEITNCAVFMPNMKKTKKYHKKSTIFGIKILNQH